MLRKILFAVTLALGLGGAAVATAPAQAAMIPASGLLNAVEASQPPAATQVQYYYGHRRYYRPRYHRPHYYYRPHYYQRCRTVWVRKWRYGRYYTVRRRVCY